MGSSKSNPLELSLSLKPSYVPKTISDLLSDLDNIDNVEKKLSVLNDYLNKYKEELSKVEALKRDLPQCMLLLMDGNEFFPFFSFFFLNSYFKKKLYRIPFFFFFLSDPL